MRYAQKHRGEKTADQPSGTPRDGLYCTKGLLPCAALDALLTQPHENRSDVSQKGPTREIQDHRGSGVYTEWAAVS